MTSLLKSLLETAAVGSVSAGAIAAVPAAAGDAPRKRTKAKKKVHRKPKQLFKSIVAEAGSEYDEVDIMSKLKAADKNINHHDAEHSVAFGVEDDDGNIVKVFVQADQADEFEETLSLALADADMDEDSENTSVEIAEVLFSLRDRFNIIDVVWPAIPEDEEVEQEVEFGDGEQSPEGEEGDVDGGDLEDEGELEPAPVVDDSAATSALQSVIDMMKADAEARKMDAEARIADANARIADAAAREVEQKVKREEELLDVEAHEKAQKEAEQEAKRIAKLAKYRQEMNHPSDEIEDDFEQVAADVSGMEDEPAPSMEEPAMEEPATAEDEEHMLRSVSPEKLLQTLIHQLRQQK